MYDYISPEKVLTTLRWLKQNNPLYADIDINDEWLEQAMGNDEDLFGGLVEQSDTNEILWGCRPAMFNKKTFEIRRHQRCVYVGAVVCKGLPNVPYPSPAYGISAEEFVFMKVLRNIVHTSDCLKHILFKFYRLYCSKCIHIM